MGSNLNVQEAQQVAHRAATSQAVTVLAHLGYAVKEVVYVVIGFLAMLLVTGNGGSTTDQNAALKAMYSSPLGEGFGRFLLIVMTVGLFCFALWSLIQAVFDTEHKGRKAKGIVARVGYAGVAVSYSLLGLGASQIASTGSASSRNSTSSAQNWTGLLLQQPAGVLLVILVGCVVLGITASLFARAYRASFAHYLNLSSPGAQGRDYAWSPGKRGAGCGFPDCRLLPSDSRSQTPSRRRQRTGRGSGRTPETAFRTLAAGCCRAGPARVWHSFANQ